MANDNHLFSVPCYNGTMLKQDYYNDFFEIGQQKINFSFYELSLPDDDPVYTLKKVMDELNYHVAGLLDTIDALYAKYNAFLYENGYGSKYDLGEARMFVIQGMEKVREVIEENRQRKLTKHKKISNDTIIEIDNCSPLEILKLQKNLMRIAEGEGIGFVSVKGKHKPEIPEAL